MTALFRKALAIGVASALVTNQSAAAQTRSGTSFPRVSRAAPSANHAQIEPGAVDALRRMSAFLMTSTTLAITSQGSLDVVTNDGQRVQLDGTTQYKIRRPGFVIDYASDMKSRRFIYDGKNFTIYSPTLGFYSTVPAPPTNQEALDTIYKKFGIALPLEDLFRWNDGTAASRLNALKSARDIGSASIDGVETEHYAFREAAVDWEIWLQKGDQPLPRKLVIVDRTDASRPTFIARLNWEVNPKFADSDFAFAPDANAKRIELATFKGLEK